MSDAALQISLQVGLVGLWLGALALLAERLSRRQGVNSEVARKVMHIGVGNVILLAWWLDVPMWIGVAASVLCSGVALVSYKLPILPGINGVGRNSLGTFFYAVSIGVLMLWFWPVRAHYAVIGILIMTWGDGLAALVGKRFGRRLYAFAGMQKSWEGSLMMAAASFVVCGLVLAVVQGIDGATLGVALAVAIAATALESFSIWGIDNLTVPVLSAALAFGLNVLWLGNL